MKIAHFSDLHLCANHLPENLIKAQILVQTALKRGADHFVFTGDIAHLGDFDDFISLRHLLAEFNLLDSRKTTIVIGNHDIFGGVHLAEDILTFPETCQKVDYQQKIRDFRLCFYELFEDTFSPNPNQIFPFGKVVENVLLVGLNSTRPYSIVKNPFASRGKIGKIQRNGLKTILGHQKYRDLVKIVLVHHHFNKPPESHKNYLLDVERFGGKLTKKHKLYKIFRRHKVALTLHGHQHRSMEYTRHGLHFLNAGASTSRNPGNLNLISVGTHKIETEIIPVRFNISPRNGTLRETPSLTLTEPVF